MEPDLVLEESLQGIANPMSIRLMFPFSIRVFCFLIPLTPYACWPIVKDSLPNNPWILSGMQWYVDDSPHLSKMSLTTLSCEQARWVKTVKDSYG